MQTMKTDRENDSNSAAVNLPHMPNEILFPSEQGLMMYWHMGSSRKARATVAITKKKNENNYYYTMLIKIKYYTKNIIISRARYY